MTTAPVAQALAARRPWARHDAVAGLAAGATLVLWDLAGGDSVLTRLFGSAQGFAWRNHALTAGLVHEGGRVLAWATLLALLVCALRAPRSAPLGAGAGASASASASAAGSLPTRSERGYWWAVTVVCLLLVPALKQISATSCPWDLAEFGGQARWVSHWWWGVSDGGPGRCFPSGHAVGAFAFLTQYFLWRGHQPQRARAWLWAVLTVGFVFGLGQLARGAHHASHSAWSAWLCWAVCVLASAAQARRRGLST